MNYLVQLVAILTLFLCCRHQNVLAIGDFAKNLLALPEWMTKELKMLASPGPSPPPEKRILFKLNGPGFYIRKMPTMSPHRYVARPSKVVIKYAPHYKMSRPYYKYPASYHQPSHHPYKFESVSPAYPPQLAYVYEKPVMSVDYGQFHANSVNGGPIQTIPAPNLGPNDAGSHVQSVQLQSVYDNPQPIIYHPPLATQQVK